MAIGCVLGIGLLAGCSAGDSGASDMAVAEAEGSMALAGGEAQDEAAADTGTTGDGATVAEAAAGRQVVTTGTVRLTVDDPREAADAVVRLVEEADGRIDARFERAETASTTASAELTVRVPSDDLTAMLDALEEVGDVDEVQLSSEDVTATSQDLDARIRALQLSVARMEDLLARATTSSDLVEAEQALSQRQAELESLQSQRARLAEQVALSTVTISLDTPGTVPAAAESPEGFWEGLVVGWQSLVVAVGGAMLVLGVLLPWIAAVGVVAVAAVALTRVVRRRRVVTPAS